MPETLPKGKTMEFNIKNSYKEKRGKGAPSPLSPLDPLSPDNLGAVPPFPPWGQSPLAPLGGFAPWPPNANNATLSGTFAKGYNHNEK